MASERRWYACRKCNEVDYYEVDLNGDADFPRGHLMVHEAYLCTGMKTREEAEQWLADNPLLADDDSAAEAR